MAATRSSGRGGESRGCERPGSGTASRAGQRVRDSAEQGSEQVKEQANGAAGSLTGEILGSFSDAAKDILGPAVQQMSAQAAERAAAFARERGPALVKDELLPKVMESAGVDNPGDLAKMGIGRAGEMISGAGGITGVAGKLMSKLGGGKGGGNATGWGQKRRMPVQQDVFVSVAVEDAYRGWTEYKRWSEYMHRANLVDPQPGEDSFRLKVTEKMWGFKRPFTAEVVSQRPNHHIRWRSTEGTKHVGVIAFHSLGEHLTLISVNIDHAPSGLLVERMARGFRFSKRAIRADLHRFKGWIEHKSDDEIAEIEGWLGTIEGGQVRGSGPRPLAVSRWCGLASDATRRAGSAGTSAAGRKPVGDRQVDRVARRAATRERCVVRPTGGFAAPAVPHAGLDVHRARRVAVTVRVRVRVREAPH